MTEICVTFILKSFDYLLPVVNLTVKIRYFWLFRASCERVFLTF